MKRTNSAPLDEQEFRAAYQRLFPLAFRVGYRFSGDRQEAEDAAQEALARAFQRWARLRREPWIAGWVLTTTLNILRKKRPIDVPAREGETSSADIESSLDLWAAVRRLPRRQAQAVVLHYLADLSVADVATVMGCREGTAKAHLDRARKRLAATIEPIQETGRENDAAV
jgi:RNA polymerase sigma factor (sigma-70 family)